MSETNRCCSLEELELSVIATHTPPPPPPPPPPNCLTFGFINQSLQCLVGSYCSCLTSMTTSSFSVLDNLCLSYCTCMSCQIKLAKGLAHHLLDLILTQCMLSTYDVLAMTLSMPSCALPMILSAAMFTYAPLL